MKYFFLLIFSPLFFTNSSAQRTREVQTQQHFWWSINNQIRVSNQWSVVADAHMRRTNFLKNNSFYFVRLGAVYHVNRQFTIGGGAGHVWLANRNGATELFTNENRLYQHAQLTHSFGNIRLQQRLRVEERWQQRVVNFLPTTEYRYSTRYRYQLSINIPVSKKTFIPSIAVADELLLQSGKDIVYNSFDQNRVFAGIRQQITNSLSFDMGYMLVYQQRLSGYQYNRNHTIRLFFYWQPDFRKKQTEATVHTILPEQQ
ncbi:MAG: DUF2490 domain-containing protein [Chitinophagaceae bacterium]|nr:DUF2490 domain-containing protein [Chitinophagaceae bacterium]